MRDYMILDVRPIWMKFFEALRCLDMPEIDHDVVFSRVFDCLKEEELVEKKLETVCIDMADHDGLFENEFFENGQKNRIYKAVKKLGLELFEYYKNHSCYIDGYMPYDYKGIFDGCALLLSEPPFSSPRGSINRFGHF